MSSPLLKLYLFSCVTLAMVACSKEHTNSTGILTGKKWKVGINDNNPSTTPNPELSLYRFVPDCEKDDTYEFRADGKLIIERGNKKCNTDEKSTDTLSYSYNRADKELLINGKLYTLLEESSTQIKYQANISSAIGFSYLIYLLQ